MLTAVALWVPCLIAGFALQQRLKDAQRASHWLFLFMLWVMSPIVVIYAYTTVIVRVEWIAALGLVVVASWLNLVIGALWARAGARNKREAGVMAIGTCMANTANVGYPLATLAFGGPGLALAVIYSEFQYLLPVEGVILGLGKRYAGPRARIAAATRVRDVLWSWFCNPPAVASIVAVVLRVAGVDLKPIVGPIGPAMGVAVGMLGFVQLGLATPVEAVARDRRDLRRAAVTLVLRCAVAPLILLGLGLVTGIHIPGVFLLLAAMPVAFNTMVVSAVFDLDTALARLLIAVSTPVVVAAVLVWHVL